MKGRRYWKLKLGSRAPKKIIVHVSADHISRGRSSDARCCIVSIAVADTVEGTAEVRTGHMVTIDWEYDGFQHSARYDSPDASRIVKTLDNGMTVWPCTVILLLDEWAEPIHLYG